MYNSILTSGSQELLNTRLTQVVNSLRSSRFATLQEAAAAIYSAVNGVMALGNEMTPLSPATSEGPAKVGDINSNLFILNQDAQAIVQQILSSETDASSLYNLFASTQNNLRQSLREKVYASSLQTYREAFLNDAQIQAGYSANLDCNAGIAASSLASDTPVTIGSLSAGLQSIGSVDPATDFAALVDGDTTTSLIWNGSQLELVLNFNPVTIVNAVRIELLGYQGLAVDSVISTPDGILQEQIPLSDDLKSLDGNSGKFSGDWVALFDPRHMQQLRILMRSMIGNNPIRLRNIYCSQRKYANTGSITSKPITIGTGPVRFSATAASALNLTSIAHQISFDGNSYTALNPGDVIQSPGQFWYRSIFTRLDSNFQAAAVPLSQPGVSNTAANYSVGNVASTDLGGGITSRTIQFSTFSGSADLEETPLDGTLTLYIGNNALPTSAYSLVGSVLTVFAAQTDLNVKYQVSSYARAGMLARQAYYSPFLSDVTFSQN